MARGKKVFTQICAACHQATGTGVPTLFPPLAKSDYLMADKARSIHIVAKGLSGPITVNGKPYNGVMPPPGLKNDQIADVLTYVRNSFGNSGDAVTVAEVEAALKDAK
jgi:nitrite reductase (NO-forming)